MKQEKLVILSDYGLDDAAAAVYLLDNRARFSAIDIVAIGGNTSTENSLNNAKKLLANYDGDLQGVRLIDSTALIQHVAHLPSIHGKDGMGDLLQSRTLRVPVLRFDDWLETLGEPFVLFSLGPCTVTLHILKRYRPTELVMMAGMVDAVPNYRGMEFNQALDADSYNACLSYPHVIATLDTCRAPLFNLAGKRRTDNSLLGKLLNRAEELAEARHPDNCYVYDYIASHYLTHPEMFDIIVQRDPWGNMLSNLKVKADAVW